MAGRLERQGSPTGWKRLLFRAPILIYRARLGLIFGHRFLMLEHVGRKSGLLRRTVLEVVVDDPDAAYVAAGWGASAQWLANVGANPAVTVTLGSHRFRTTAELMTAAQAHDLMSRYAHDHPKALEHLAGFMLDDPGESGADQAARVAEAIPMVRLPKT
jgi:deazaflavin-dependent oxidoreductase (nitroreductase family)